VKHFCKNGEIGGFLGCC